jgi:hypothetical protein
MSFALLSKAGIAIALAAAISVGFLGGFATNNAFHPAAATPPATTLPQVILPPPAPGACSWQSDPFAGIDASEQADLQLHDACGTISGTVQSIYFNVEGEQRIYHFLIKPDAQFATMLNDGNNAKQNGCLVIEVEPTDSAIIPRLHINQHLEVQGPFVLDVPNGWNEIHPAKMVTEIA